jgi:hypothetical protein
MSSGPGDDPLLSESASSRSFLVSGPLKSSLLLKAMFIFFRSVSSFFQSFPLSDDLGTATISKNEATRNLQSNLDFRHASRRIGLKLWLFQSSSPEKIWILQRATVA